MDTKRFDIILRAEQPIAHHAEVLGNAALLMRRKVRQPDGGFADVPYITGDTMRHGLREAAAMAYLDAAGLLGATLSEAALRLLFAGGMVTGSAGGSVRLGDYRELCELFPPLALLGGCAQNRVIPGRLAVDEATLICTETAHLLPEHVLEWVGAAPLSSQRAHVEEAQRVRMDPLLDPSKRTLLVADQRQQVEMRMELREGAATDAAAAETKSTMLPRTYERVVQGSLFWWRVTATCWDDLDHDTLMVMLAAFLYEARVGGKRGTGCGLLAPVQAWGAELRRPSERPDAMDVRALGARVGERFRAHVAERRARIADFLGRVAA